MTITVYMLENSQGRIYIGVTKNLARRLNEHNTGTSYITSKDSASLDWEVFHTWHVKDAMEALRLEQYLKELSHQQAIDLALDCPNYGPYLRLLCKDVHITADTIKWHRKKGYAV